MRFHCLNFSNLILSLFIVSSSISVNAQNHLYKRLKKLEQNHPEKVAPVSNRYSIFYKNNPVIYYFLSKDQLAKFNNETDQVKQHKIISEAIKFATLAQKYGNKKEFNKKEEWLIYRGKLNFTAYFYFQESPPYPNKGKLKEKYYLFMSYGKHTFMIDKDLNIEFPENEKIDSLFYGLPSGNEIVKPIFIKNELEMLSLINKEREILGLSTVEIDSSLSAACRYHAYDMATQNYVDHYGYDLGKDGKVYFANRTFDRIRQFYHQSRILNENISWGRKRAYNTYIGWIESSSHYKNLFNPSIKKVGIGFVYDINSKYKYYWVFNAAE